MNLYHRTNGKYSKEVPNFDSLEGVDLTITAIDSSVYRDQIAFKAGKREGLQFVSGLCYELLMCLQQALKFNYQAIRHEHWISFYPNGTTKGLTGQVMYGKADISIAQASMVMLTQALPNISYLHPTSSGKLTAIFRQPDAHNNRDILVPSSNLSLFILWIVTCILIGISFKLCQQITPKFDHDISISKDTELQTSVLVWWFQSLTCQGWQNYPRNISIRVMLLISIMFASLTMSHYAASLTSLLATENIPIRSFEELGTSSLRIFGDVSLPVVKDIVTETYKKHRGMTIPDDKKSPYFIRIAQSSFVILNQSSAFITFSDTTKQIFGDQKSGGTSFCNVSSVRVGNGPLPNAMFVKQGSYLKEIFNRKILVMQERGLTHRIHLSYSFNSTIKCPKIFKKYRGGLGIKDILTAFVLIGFGISVGFASIFAEIIALRHFVCLAR